MTSVLGIIVLGFFLGMRHAMDPDHVVAVTTIVSKQHSMFRAAMIGVLWGLGHTFTIFLVGAAIILFNVAIPPRLGLSMELSVGLMLVLLGALNITGFTKRLTQRFTPSEAGGLSITDAARSPAQKSSGSRLEGLFRNTFRTMGAYQALRPIAVGIVHGLAGSAAIALLLMTTIHNPWLAIAYLLIFGAGTVAGMMLITALVALPFAYTAKHFGSINRGLVAVSAGFSVCFGLFLAYQIGIVNGLFTGHPQWTPR